MIQKQVNGPQSCDWEFDDSFDNIFGFILLLHLKHNIIIIVLSVAMFQKLRMNIFSNEATRLMAKYKIDESHDFVQPRHLNNLV